jgi:ubiquinone/menaquinone biosynthesis C-methylase UbiE
LNGNHQQREHAFWRELFERKARTDKADHRLVGYESSSNARLLSQTLHRLIGPIEGKRFLDAGSGDGQVSAAFMDRNRVVCSDFSAGMARRAMKRGAGGVACDLLALPFADASFDLAICVEVVQCTPDPEAVAGELLRVLRPGGRLLMTTPNKHSALRRVNRLLRPSRSEVAPRLAATGDFRRMFESLGASVERVVYVAYYIKWVAESRGGPLEPFRRLVATNFIIQVDRR